MSTPTSINADECLKDLRATRQEWAAWADARWIPWRGVGTIDAYADWLDRGHHGEMEYLARHLALKKDPGLLLPGVSSLILVSKSYVPPASPHGVFENLRLAAYARGRDYHDEFGDELRSMAEALGDRFPDHSFRAGTDSLPVLERDLARQAGLGWVGKNTCLIHPKKGSFFFIGAILSTLPVATSTEIAELPDFCGTCTRCIEACPTGALEAPRTLNATKCISYWTIESRGLPAPSLADQFGDWFFGCDICQSVCPWNQKPLRGQSVLQVEPLPISDLTRSELREVLSLDDTSLRQKLKPTPLSRAKPLGLRRNALIVAKNRRIVDLRPEIETWVTDPFLGDLARRALESFDA